MSHSYIGPFGRLLPANRKEESQEENNTQSASKPATMLATSAPHLPLPARLQFGTDPLPGFTDPSRYETTRDSRSTHGGNRLSPTYQKLPSVSQLLTPSSPENREPPYSRHAGIVPAVEPRTNPHSPRRISYSDSYNRTDSSYFPRAYATAPPTQSGYLADHTVQSNSNSVSYRLPPRDEPETTMPRYAGSSEQGPSQPVKNVPSATPHGSWYSESSQSSMRSPREAPDSSKPEARSVTKPVRRLLGEQVIDGVGPCYVYEDGSHVRKIIDGEAVNANWGITKAGKPRKRLAIACKTCREKKIKCEPGEPKCVQCDKSGRECRFETARSNRRH